MPANVVKAWARDYKKLTPGKMETKWDKARAAAKKQGFGGKRDKDYAYSMAILKKMTQKYKKPGPLKKESMMTEREELREFINEHAEDLDELREATISANLAIPTNIGGQDTDEDIPDDVHDHEVDATDDTQPDERTGIMGIKPGSGKDDPND